MTAPDRHTFFCELCDAMYVIDAADQSRLCDRCYLACNPHPPAGALVRYADRSGRVVNGLVVSHNGRRIVVRQVGTNRVAPELITRWERIE